MLGPALIAVFLAAGPPAPAPTPPAAPTPSPDFRREYCSLLTQCDLKPAPGLCSDEERTALPGVKYDDGRCGHARELSSRGLSSESAEGFAVYRFLGKRYRVSYLVEGDLPMSPARLAFLIDDLPLAAKLLSRLGQHRYTAEYTDDTRRRFRGSKEETLTGEATLVAGHPGEGWMAYFGRGRSKVGFWRLGGLSFAEFLFEPHPAPASGLKYALKIVVTPDNAMMNRIMTLGLFRSLVQGQIRQVVDDIDRASRRLAESGLDGLDQDWTPEERARIAQFLRLP